MKGDRRDEEKSRSRGTEGSVEAMSTTPFTPFSPDYASYNHTGAPANYSLTTNDALGGDSRTSLLFPFSLQAISLFAWRYAID